MPAHSAEEAKRLLAGLAVQDRLRDHPHEEITTRVTVTLGWWERLRALYHGTVHVMATVHLSNPSGEAHVVCTQSMAWVPDVVPRRYRGAMMSAEPLPAREA